MKKWTIPLGRMNDEENKPLHPDRTAYKSGSGMFADLIFQEWPNRASMAKTIRIQQRGESFNKAWKACIPLGETEGY